MANSIQCDSCNMAINPFDSMFFRNFQLCEYCFNDDGVIRSCMDLHAAKRDIYSMNAETVDKDKLLSQLKEICFAGAWQRRQNEMKQSNLFANSHKIN